MWPGVIMSLRAEQSEAWQSPDALRNEIADPAPSGAWGSPRNSRRDGLESIKKLEKDKQISEDESRKEQEHIQKLTDKYIKETDELSAHKEKEVMSV